MRPVALSVAALLIVAVVLAGVLWSGRDGGDDRPGQAGGAATTTVVSDGAAAGLAATVTEVVDGDTIWVRMPDGSEEKVRYIGIDAPELPHEDSPGEYLGREAASHNEALLTAGPLRLETDVESRDEFERLLAYVWAGDVFVNERMVLDGYAWAHNYPPNLSRQDQLWAAHDRARETGVGVWQ